MKEIHKIFGEKAPVKEDDINCHITEWSQYADVDFDVGNFSVRLDDSTWEDQKKISSLFAKGKKAFEDINILKREIETAESLITDGQVAHVKKKISSSMSVGSHMSDMEVAVAIVANPDNTSNIDLILAQLDEE